MSADRGFRLTKAQKENPGIKRGVDVSGLRSASSSRDSANDEVEPPNLIQSLCFSAVFPGFFVGLFAKAKTAFPMID
jgi:hypothetical protein